MKWCFSIEWYNNWPMGDGTLVHKSSTTDVYSDGFKQSRTQVVLKLFRYAIWFIWFPKGRLRE